MSNSSCVVYCSASPAADNWPAPLPCPTQWRLPRSGWMAGRPPWHLLFLWQGSHGIRCQQCRNTGHQYKFKFDWIPPSLSPAHLPRLTPLHVPDVQSESVAVTAPGNVGVDVNISSVTIFRSAEHPSQCRAGASWNIIYVEFIRELKLLDKLGWLSGVFTSYELWSFDLWHFQIGAIWNTSSVDNQFKVYVTLNWEFLQVGITRNIQK